MVTIIFSNQKFLEIQVSIYNGNTLTVLKQYYNINFQGILHPFFLSLSVPH